MKNQEYYIDIECSNCKKIFKILHSYYEHRTKIGQKTFCCSRICTTEVTKEIISIAQKGKPKSEHQKQKLKENAKINPNYGFKNKKHKRESCDKIRKATLGKLNPNWNEGSSLLSYCPKFNRSLKESIRKRDGYVCQHCGKTQIQKRKLLSVHHIHYDKPNCYPDLITLCDICNTKVNKLIERKSYENLFMNKLNERGLLFWTKRRNNTEHN